MHISHAKGMVHATCRGTTTPLISRKNFWKWWATLESNQAWVSPAELQSAAAPCSTSPDARRGLQEPMDPVKAIFRPKATLFRHGKWLKPSPNVANEQPAFH